MRNRKWSLQSILDHHGKTDHDEIPAPYRHDALAREAYCRGFNDSFGKSCEEAFNAGWDDGRAAAEKCYGKPNHGHWLRFGWLALGWVTWASAIFFLSQRMTLP